MDLTEIYWKSFLKISNQSASFLLAKLQASSIFNKNWNSKEVPPKIKTEKKYFWENLR